MIMHVEYFEVVTFKLFSIFNSYFCFLLNDKDIFLIIIIMASGITKNNPVLIMCCDICRFTTFYAISTYHH